MKEPAVTVPVVTLRPATPADVVWLDLWDHDPAVVACSTDDPNAMVAFEDVEWADELAMQSAFYQYFIAELDGRPIGAMQICDPQLEETHYWGEMAPNLRAIDIWIGAAADRGKGYGADMMRLGARPLLRGSASHGASSSIRSRRTCVRTRSIAAWDSSRSAAAHSARTTASSTS